MVVSVEHNREFILIHTVAGYGRALARAEEKIEEDEREIEYLRAQARCRKNPGWAKRSAMY
ncbi:hypothetical protein AWE90_26165 [Escherichia coli]|nr:hypothetical protein AWE90_26165 [Escherichia coli]